MTTTMEMMKFLIAGILLAVTDAAFVNPSLPWKPWSSSTMREAAIAPGDTVLVVGGTGGVGQLTVGKLQQRNVSVRTTSRNPAKAQDLMGPEVDVLELDLLSQDTSALERAMEGVSAVVVSVGTTAFPTLKWKGGNTPKAVDQEAVARIANAASRIDTMKKMVLVTSIGVERTNEMPFVILNLFGVLDAKKSGEEAVAATASKSGLDFVIIRPGRLVGGPYTNEDLAKLFQVDGGSGTTIERGDTLLGDCRRDGCAEAVVQSLLNENCKNIAFSIMSNEEEGWNEGQWTTAFNQL